VSRCGARIRHLLAVVPCLLLVACTFPGLPVADDTSAPDGAVVSYLTERQQAPPSGLRVLDDGDAQVLDDGTWRSVWRYDDAALAELRKATATAAAGLDDRYGTAGQDDASVQTWRLAADGGLRTTVIAGPHALPPPLQRLYRRIFELRPQEDASSVWRVRVGDDLVERHVDGEPAGVKAIAPLVGAVFAPAGKRGDELPSDDAAPLLVEIEWSADGKLTETTRVYADGRNVSVKGGVEEEQRRYTADEVRAIGAAVEQVGWASLPDPLSPG
jgi:hypothetical protein